MNRLIIALVAVLMVALLAATSSAALAQGNDISCPPGAASDAAGTTCTDLTTGETVAPVSQTIVYPPTPNTNTCPEEWVRNADGTCVPVGTATPIADPPPPPVSGGAGMLPATGGPLPLLVTSFAIAAGVGMLAGAGYMIRHRYR